MPQQSNVIPYNSPVEAWSGDETAFVSAGDGFDCSEADWATPKWIPAAGTFTTLTITPMGYHPTAGWMELEDDEQVFTDNETHVLAPIWIRDFLRFGFYVHTSAGGTAASKFVIFS